MQVMVIVKANEQSEAGIPPNTELIRPFDGRGGEVEIRPFFSMEDFGESLTAELKEQSQKRREREDREENAAEFAEKNGH